MISNAEGAENRRVSYEPDISENKNRISEAVIGAAIEVHKSLGPGLLEKAYEECLYYLLCKQGYIVERQKEMPVVFQEVRLDCGFRLDLLVNDTVIVELKTVERILPVHEAQLYTYLKLSKKPLGLILNFNVSRLVDGIKRMAMTR